MIHHVCENAGELQAVLFIGNQFLLDAEIEVKIRKPADSPSPTGVGIEAEDQRTDAVVNGNRVGEHVDRGRGSAGVNGRANSYTIRIGAAEDATMGVIAAAVPAEEDAVFGISQVGSIVAAEALAGVVGRAGQWLACARGQDWSECPTSGDSTDKAVLSSVPGSFIDNESIEDDPLVEALTALLLARIVVVHIG